MNFVVTSTCLLKFSEVKLKQLAIFYSEEVSIAGADQQYQFIEYKKTRLEDSEAGEVHNQSAVQTI